MNLNICRSLLALSAACMVHAIAGPVTHADCPYRWVARDTGTDEQVLAIAAFDGGAGPTIYAGGYFTQASGIPANGLVRWDGAAWVPVGVGVNGTVRALTVFDDGSGSGPALFVGGNFTTAGGFPNFNRIAKYRLIGSIGAWQALGSGMDPGSPPPVPESPFSSPDVRVFAVFDDGQGPALYAGGSFETAGGVTVNSIAKWTGSTWQPLTGPAGTGVTLFDANSNELPGGVSAMAVFDDGTGPALYVGGTFSRAGGVTAWSIARWNGSQWSPVTGSAGQGTNGRIRALEVYDDGAGQALFVGGDFSTVDGFAVPANNIAKWDGTNWIALAGGGVIGGNGVNTLRVFDDASCCGPALFVGGSFTQAGVNPDIRSLARYRSIGPFFVWEELPPLTGGVPPTGNSVSTLFPFDDASTLGSALYVGGGFTSAGGVAASRIVAWASPDCTGDVNCDGAIDLGDFAILAVNFGAGPGATTAQGDLNGDGFVDLADFAILAVNFGGSCP